MATFRDRPWASRVAAGGMGDEAESVFEQWATNQGIGFARYGLNRPPIHVHKLPDLIRYTPDYLMTARLVEVQGFGRDQTFKLKEVKLAALEDWTQIHPVSMFAWDSHGQRAFMVDLEAIASAAATGGLSKGAFPEGHVYYEYPAALLAEIGQVL